MRVRHRVGVLAFAVIIISILQFSSLYLSTKSSPPVSPLSRSDRNNNNDGKDLEDGLDFVVRPVLNGDSFPTPSVTDSHNSTTTKTNSIIKDKESTIYASSLRSHSPSPRKAAHTKTLRSQLEINSNHYNHFNRSIHPKMSIITDKSDNNKIKNGTLGTTIDLGDVKKFRDKERKRVQGGIVNSSDKEVNKLPQQPVATIPRTGMNYVNGSHVSSGKKSILSHKSSIKKRNATISSIVMSDQTSGSGSQNVRTVLIPPQEAFFWKGAQAKLCKRLKKERKKNQSHFKTITPYQHRKDINPENNVLRMEVNAPCSLLHAKHMHGNFILGFYGMRLAALAFDADFYFRCSDMNPKDVNGKEYLLWWLQTERSRLEIQKDEYNGKWKAGTGILSTNRTNEHATNSEIHSINHTLYTPSKPTSKNACLGMGKAALQYTTEYARRDLRIMAMELAPSIEGIDDVAIHFRCGDVLSSGIPQEDDNYGLLKFQAYRRRIPTNTKTIGIVTAPFSHAASLRKQDRSYSDSCQHLVTQLQSYLQKHFPKASVHVRNDPHDSIPTVFARFILAKVTFCARSTFCLFPAVAAFGRSYVQRDGVAYFMDHVSMVYDNILLMDEPFLRSYEIGKRGFNSTVHWLIEN